MYTLNWTDSLDKAPIVINDYITDTTSTSLTLYGHYTADWGAGIEQDLIRLLENFSSPTIPTNPTKGQVWYDTGSVPFTLRVFDGASFLSVFDQAIVALGNYVPIAGTTMTGYLILNADPVAALGAATKGYVDNMAAGVRWLEPVSDTNLIDDSLSTPPITPVNFAVYIVGLTGTGAWTGLDGHALYWNGSAWVDILGRAIAVGDRFGVTFEFGSASEGGNMVGQHNAIATVVTATPGSYAYTFTAPNNNDAVFDNEQNSLQFGHSYTYILSSTSWIEFSGPSVLIAGAGLSYTGNTMNVGTANVANIVVNADNIDLATTAVTPGTYTKVTVDAYGRATAGATLISTDVTTALGYTPVNLAGDTMTGLLILSGDPAVALGAATKQYVDNGLATKIGAADYATSTTGGTVKARLTGTDLYLTTNGVNP